ncbi:MAG: asparagine synthase (glutamine-hydrolyzing) [Paucibacter sp.]|nr:asparagine synthase (glutamine-hydrolyzing) [Roseateles sp.]
MCGIVLCHVPAGSAARHALRMNDALRHRGPDGEGYLLVRGSQQLTVGGPDTSAEVMASPWGPRDGRIEPHLDSKFELMLAQRRLSIVDLSAAGHQPMRGQAGQWVVFNGEIYNHLELREQLMALGHVFHSHSDTEVLLAAFAEWGEAALQRFNGMWAFVIYDPARGELFIARDRFGVKPLYVWQGAGGELLLASEIKSLLAHPLVQTAPDRAACQEFLTSGPNEAAQGTLFEGIQRFPAGHFARYALGSGRLQPQSFWAWPQAAQGDAPFSAPEAAQVQARYLELLDDAVRLRLRSDVPVGTALSGGLDSSSVAMLVNRQLRRLQVEGQQQVFSSVYLDPRYRDSDESSFIAEVAAQLQVSSHRIEARWQDLPQEHERMIWALDTPPANTLMSSWHTYRLVAEQGVTVTLDGQGADEQLAGYARYVRNHVVNAPWGESLRAAAHFQRVMPGFAAQLGSGLGLKALASLAGPAAAQRLVGLLRMGSRPMQTVDQALRADFAGPLANLIHYADRSAMAWSVESRMPFMDYRLVEFLAQVPPAYKLHQGWTKWLARAAVAPQLPQNIVWRRDKLGWPIPEVQWFGGPLKSWLTQQLSASDFAGELMAASQARPGLASQLRALNLARWHQIYFEEAGRPGRALGRDLLPALTRDKA